MATGIYWLRWSDVDPARFPFDATRAQPVAAERIAQLVRGRGGIRGDSGRVAVEVAVDRAFIATSGAWAAGWRWSATEPGGGGPVHAWCCGGHSVLLGSREAWEETAARAAAALREWRGVLVALAANFANLHEETAALPLEQAIEHAASQLLPLVVERTDAQDAWYRTFGLLLSWYVESAGHDPDGTAGMIFDLTSGRFASWCAPDDTLAKEVCVELGLELAALARARPESRDGLGEWLNGRRQAFAGYVESPALDEIVHGDAHLSFIETRENARDPARASRMKTGLAASRASAAMGEPLDFQRLAIWQAFVLGVDQVAFRTTEAFAKGGRERYALETDTSARFAAALAEANDTAVSPTVRAARAYLDVCFFHPFADGNGRAARLALDYVLTSSGRGLHAIEPILAVSRSAADIAGASQLAHVIHALSGRRP